MTYQTLEELREAFIQGKEVELINKTTLVENLDKNLKNEYRPLTILLIDSFVKKMEDKIRLTAKDVQAVRLLHSQILDQIQVLKDKTLRKYLQEVKGKLENFLDKYHKEFGELPVRSTYEYDYVARRESYGYHFPIRSYYQKYYPKRETKYWKKTKTGLMLEDHIKTAIQDYMRQGPSRRHEHPDEEIEAILQYTNDRLLKDLKELKERNKRLKKLEKLELSKDPVRRREKLLDLFIESLKHSKIGSM